MTLIKVRPEGPGKHGPDTEIWLHSLFAGFDLQSFFVGYVPF